MWSNRTPTSTLGSSFAAKVDLITDPSFVNGYAFILSFRGTRGRMKLDGDGKFRNHPRPIKYAAHLDRCIYQYDSGLLNERYNDLAARIGIGDCAVAYRTNLKGQSKNLDLH